ncbi:MAG: hypothetical protein E7452_06010 [Ruminococcaceae bacterium]|nr:hypothetical protein [Oscillospiraceae bacterium]
MTGKEALTMAANIVHETDLSPYLETAKTWINVILGELYDIANRRREWRGEMAFYSLPQIEDLEDDLPYDEEMNVRVLVKGLVARLFSEDCDNAQLTMYRQEYELAARELDRAVVRIITEGGKAHESFAAFGI